MKKFLLSFTFAGKGLAYAFQTQLNFKVHVFVSLVAILSGVLLEINTQEWLWILLAIAMVLITELINTALEILVDLVSPEYHPKAGAVKDVAAAAVLIMAFLSVLIGLIIFVPKLI